MQQLNNHHPLAGGDTTATAAAVNGVLRRVITEDGLGGGGLSTWDNKNEQSQRYNFHALPCTVSRKRLESYTPPTAAANGCEFLNDGWIGWPSCTTIIIVMFVYIFIKAIKLYI